MRRLSQIDMSSKTRGVWNVRPSPEPSPVIGRPLGRIDRADRDLALIEVGETRNGIQKRRLARAVGADDRVDLARRDGHVDTVERDHLAVGLARAAHRNADRRRGCPAARRHFRAAQS